MQKITTVFKIDAYFFVGVVALLVAFVTAPGHAAVGESEIVADEPHKLVYLCQIKRDNGAAFSDLRCSLVDRPSIFKFWDDYRLWRLGVDARFDDFAIGPEHREFFVATHLR